MTRDPPDALEELGEGPPLGLAVDSPVERLGEDLLERELDLADEPSALAHGKEGSAAGHGG